jgi:hypothetical protein
MSKTVSAGRTPKIEVENTGGDLSIVGWEGEDILFKTDEDQLRVQQEDDIVRISTDDDLSLRVPRGASIAVINAGGDMALKSVTGGVALQEVHGDLAIRDVENIAVQAVHGDFSLRAARGNVSVKLVQGDASIREVGGHVAIESISDDLALRDVRGNVSANVGEDVVLYLDPQPGNAYSITAGEDILLVMPPRANATLTLNGDEIDVDWKGITNDEAISRVVTLGDGSAVVTLNAGGDIRVTNQSDAGESAEDFGNFAGVGFDWSGFGERISRQVEAATRRAGKQAERAARRINARVNMGRWNWDLTPRGTSAPPGDPVSDEERMAILKMLQEKKITAEEAEKLLAALEGGS